MDREHEAVADICPRCRVGRLQKGSKPFLRLFRGHLFTIPDALIYQCDVCAYYEFDETSFEIISDMMFGATLPEYDNGKTQPLPPPSAEDDLPPTQPKRPQV